MWTVQDLVHHVIGGNATVVVLVRRWFDGIAAAQCGLLGAMLGEDVEAKFADGAAAQAAA